MFTVPWYQSLVFGGDVGGISRIVTVISIPFAAFAVLSGGHLRRVTKVHWLILAHLMIAALTLFWTADVDATATSIRGYLQVMVIVWLVWEFAGDNKSIRQLATAYVLGGWVSLVNTVLAGVGAMQARTVRTAASGFNENDLALVLTLGIPMACYAAARAPRYVRWICWTYVAVAPVTILMTGSRSGAVVLVISLTSVALFGMRRGFLTRGVLIAGLATVMAVGVSLVPAQTIERILTVSNSGNFGDRLPIWGIALRTLSDHPALGIGSGAFLHAGGANYLTHNTFLSVLVEHGIAGFMVFLGIVGALIAGIWQMRGQGRYAWITLLICWCVGVSTLTWEQSRWTWALFAMAAALPRSGEDEMVPVVSVKRLMSGAY
jgi:hypothetical protein